MQYSSEAQTQRSGHRTEQEAETSVVDGITGQVGKSMDWI